MNPKLLRLVLAAVLFGAWMSYLGYLVYALPKPPRDNDLDLVLSRPQLLVSEVDVIGIIEDKDGNVLVEKVLYPRDDNTVQEKMKIKVVNLDKVRVLKKVGDDKEERWEEKPPAVLEHLAALGPCLLPLRHTADGTAFEVVRLPFTPGTRFTAPRIYPATPETLAEYQAIQKP